MTTWHSFTDWVARHPNEEHAIGVLAGIATILALGPPLLGVVRMMAQQRPWIRRRVPRYNNAPALPLNYVDRPETLAKLRQRLTDRKTRSSIAMTALQGMGGIGKTLLAQAICHDHAVKKTFPDGIVWLPIGKESTRSVATLMSEVGRTFGEELPADISDLSATSWYRTAVRYRAALIVLDDVWNAHDLDPFRAEAPRSRVLFTTRDASVAETNNAQVLAPGFLSDKQSREVFATWAGLIADTIPAGAEELIRECSGLPLALATSGAMLRGKAPDYWKVVRNLLQKADLGKLRQQFPDYPYPDLLRALQVSVDALDPKMRERYFALAVMLEDMRIHPLVQRVLWNADEFEALETAEEFVRLALAQRAGDDGGIRLHDLLLDYVRAQYPDRAALGVIHEAMRLSSHIIERDPGQFASQLVGRLLPYLGTPAVRDFTDALVKAASRPWLRPLFPALRPPGTGLLRTLEGHAGAVVAVAVTPDGRRAVSGSEDKTLKVWDLASGRALQTLEGHADLVMAVTVTPDGRHAVSGSADHTLKVWDLESGRVLQTLEGHAGSVWAVAVTPDGRRAISASLDHTLKVWDLQSGAAIATFSCDAAASCCAVAKDSTVVAGDQAGGVYILALEN